MKVPLFWQPGVKSRDFVDTESRHIVDNRSHDIVDRMSQYIVDSFTWVIWQFQYMNKPLPPRVRAMIINFDPAQPDALTISEFCKTQKISRSIFYRICSRASIESASALHPQSRAPHHPARRYGPEVVNELVRIRKQLKRPKSSYLPFVKSTAELS